MTLFLAKLVPAKRKAKKPKFRTVNGVVVSTRKPSTTISRMPTKKKQGTLFVPDSQKHWQKHSRKPNNNPSTKGKQMK
jgi:hypothetical protein